MIVSYGAIQERQVKDLGHTRRLLLRTSVPAPHPLWHTTDQVFFLLSTPKKPKRLHENWIWYRCQTSLAAPIRFGPSPLPSKAKL